MSTDIVKAVEILKQGGLVAFPTETVYGLGADATNSEAIKKIFQAKGRPSTNPLIVHVADITLARKYAAEWPQAAQLLAEKFWPGPLTLVLPKSPAIVDQVTAGKSTVGLRVPNHPLALELLKQFNGPLAAPSANRSTRVSPTFAWHVRDEFGERVDFIVDGGQCAVGIESTVLDLTTSVPTILRPGAIMPSQIRSVIGQVKLSQGFHDPSTPASSPGQQEVHYAPRALAYRFEPTEFFRIEEWRGDGSRESAVVRGSAILTIGPHEHPLTMEMPTDPAEYAQELYADLRMLDKWDAVKIMARRPRPPLPRYTAVFRHSIVSLTLLRRGTQDGLQSLRYQLGSADPMPLCVCIRLRQQFLFHG